MQMQMQNQVKNDDIRAERLAFLMQNSEPIVAPKEQMGALSKYIAVMSKNVVQSNQDLEDEILRMERPPKTSGKLSVKDALLYSIENRIASNGAFPFLLLAIFFVIILSSFGAAWYHIANNSGPDVNTDEVLGKENMTDAFFVSMQVLMAAGFDDIPGTGLRVLYFLMIFFGLVVFAILVGFITDSVTFFMTNLAQGKTKVAETSHTLILGWNEATLRIVVQTSFLRRQFQTLNEEKFYNITVYIPWLNIVFNALGLLERPSTSLAANDIVIMTNTMTKEEMHDQLHMALEERGINPRRTKIGQNIICRVGDPTNVNDLIRVGAHRAAAVLVMLTEQDNEEEDYSDGNVHNGATLRCALALRHVIFGHPFNENNKLNPELRIVLQMTSPSNFIDAACFKDRNDLDVIMPMDLSIFLNSLMFSCAAQPGLAKVILNILNFDGISIRRRKAQNLKSGKENQYGACIGRTFGAMRTQFTKAIFIGIARPSIIGKENMMKAGFGICPDPNTIIEKDDLLIFIGPKSNPMHDYSMVETMNNYIEESKSIIDVFAPSGSTEIKTLKHILLCGWRVVWEEVPERFGARCKELIAHSSPGSTVVMLNGVDSDIFDNLMSQIDFTRGPDDVMEGSTKVHRTYNHATYPGISIIHVVGDASVSSTLEPVVLKRAITTAIVLGTQASVRLNGHSRDTRVLSIMLLLRKLANVKAMSGDAGFMHIVGENTEDLTAKLALAPRASSTETTDEVHAAPDFINTQAIYARVLTQTMAYPLIAPAISELFEESPGSANIEIVRCSAYVAMELYSVPKYSKGIPYGIIRACVLQATGERSICIGYITSHDSAVYLTPAHDKLVNLNEHDKLVILRRQLL